MVPSSDMSLYLRQKLSSASGLPCFGNPAGTGSGLYGPSQGAGGCGWPVGTGGVLTAVPTHSLPTRLLPTLPEAPV